MKKKVSIKDVAEKAGVSVTTVSRVINKKPYPVSDKLRKKVEHAVKKLNYIPNKVAQNLRTSKTNLIGLIIRDIADPYYSQVAQGVTEEVRKKGYMAMVCDSKRDPQYELEYLDLLVHQQVEGIIIAGGGYTSNVKDIFAKKISNILAKDINVVALAPQGIELPIVTVDNILVGKKLGECLIKNNHKNIAFIGGAEDVIPNQHRLKGLENELKNNGLKIPKQLIINREFTWKGGYKAAKELFQKNKDITAISCANDNIAIGVLRFLRESGRKVPDDISLISVGDTSLAKYTNPPLTTVKIPLYELGRNSAELIFDDELSKDIKICLPVTVIKRESVRKI